MRLGLVPLRLPVQTLHLAFCDFQSDPKTNTSESQAPKYKQKWREQAVALSSLFFSLSPLQVID